MFVALDLTSWYAGLVGVLVGVLVLFAFVKDLFGFWGWLKKRVRGTEDAAQRRREHDQRMLREIREMLPRGIVQVLLRDQDFGAGWRQEWMTPVNRLSHRNQVEHRFLDEELENRRVELHEAIATLARLFGQHSWPQEGRAGQEWQDVGVVPGAPDAEETKLWVRRKGLLNDAATRAADAYDALIDDARRKTLLEPD